jgi:restriction system protein
MAVWTEAWTWTARKAEPYSPMTNMNAIPQYHAFFNPVLRALKALGGSGSIKEIDDHVIDSMKFSNDAIEIMHDPEGGNKTEIEYRLGWARTYLKKYGLIDNSSRGVWSLTKKAESVHEVNPEQVIKHVREAAKARDADKQHKSKEELSNDENPEIQSWRVELYKLLTKALDPPAFERLVQRLLRESGFIQVEVTGKTGDGGIDGKGIARIHGLMSFHVIFQCKRYQGVVSASEVRDFRGAMVGRADKGLFITTGSFTRDAIKEATRDGAPPIDLLDGDALADKLKELKLGVKIEMIEKATVDSDWFKAI